MGNKKIGLGLMLNLIGAMFAYLIGSGFASGQETMQYFSSWGSVWTSLGVAAIALLLLKNMFICLLPAPVQQQPHLQRLPVSHFSMA